VKNNVAEGSLYETKVKIPMVHTASQQSLRAVTGVK